MHAALWLRNLLLLGLAGGMVACAALKGAPAPRAAPAQTTFKHKGFSLRVSEAGWIVANRQPDRLDLVRRGAYADESYALHVFTFSLPPLNAADNFANYVKERRRGDADFDPERFRLISRASTPRMIRSGECVQFHDTAEDRGAVKRSSNTNAIIVESLSTICPHPRDSYLAIDIAYSHRHYAGNADARLRDKLDEVLQNIDFDSP